MSDTREIPDCDADLRGVGRPLRGALAVSADLPEMVDYDPLRCAFIVDGHRQCAHPARIYNETLGAKLCKAHNGHVRQTVWFIRRTIDPNETVYETRRYVLRPGDRCFPNRGRKTQDVPDDRRCLFVDENGRRCNAYRRRHEHPLEPRPSPETCPNHYATSHIEHAAITAHKRAVATAAQAYRDDQNAKRGTLPSGPA